MRRGEGKKSREKLVQLAFKDNKEAADQIRCLADGLENCKNTSDIIFALTEIFCVSEATVFRDLKG